MEHNTSKAKKTAQPRSTLREKAQSLKMAGFSAAQTASKLGVSKRHVFLLWAEKESEVEVRVIQPPLSREDMEPEALAMLEFTADGFERFFNAFSNRTLQPVHKRWVDIAISNKRLLINCPPRHAKSTIFSVWFPLWLIAVDRDVQILICSQTDKLAKKFTNEIAYHLSNNMEMQEAFGRFRPDRSDWPWRPNQGELLVDGRRRETKSGDLTIQVRGSGQQILGMEANWIITDDAVDRESTRTEGMREKLSEWFHGDVMSRLEPKGRAIVIGQRLHLFDLYGELASEKLSRVEGAPPRWTHINFPAVLDWDSHEVLWPNKWGYEELMDVFADVGSQNFEAMYQQNPLPEGERLARTEWIFGDATNVGCTDLDRSMSQIRILQNDEDKLQRVRVLSIDPSPTKMAGLIVADVPYSQTSFAVEVLEIQHEPMNVRRMLGEIQRVLKQYAPVDYFIFEQNAAQRWLLQDPEMDRIRNRCMVIPHTTNRNKADPQLGVAALSLDFEYGRIRLPFGDNDGKKASQLLIDEAVTWPQGQTDDVLMALWFIKYNYQRLVPRKLLEGQSQERGRGFRPPPRLSRGFSWAR